MINNRRSFLKGVAGVFGMVAGGALLPKTGDDLHKALFINGERIAEYKEATVFNNDKLVVYLPEKEWQRLYNPYSLPFNGGVELVELCNNGITQGFRCVCSGINHSCYQDEYTVALCFTILNGAGFITEIV